MLAEEVFWTPKNMKILVWNPLHSHGSALGPFLAGIEREFLACHCGTALLAAATILLALFPEESAAAGRYQLNKIVYLFINDF